MIWTSSYNFANQTETKKPITKESIKTNYLFNKTYLASMFWWVIKICAFIYFFLNWLHVCCFLKKHLFCLKNSWCTFLFRDGISLSRVLKKLNKSNKIKLKKAFDRMLSNSNCFLLTEATKKSNYIKKKELQW